MKIQSIQFNWLNFVLFSDSILCVTMSIQSLFLKVLQSRNFHLYLDPLQPQDEPGSAAMAPPPPFSFARFSPFHFDHADHGEAEGMVSRHQKGQRWLSG